MGIFGKLAKAFGSSGDAKADATAVDGVNKELQSLTKDGRLHARYALQDEGIASLKLDGLPVGVVKDISYGGLATRFQSTGGDLPTTLPNVLNATLVVLDQEIAVKLSTVRVVHQNPRVAFAGFSMHHESAATLVFLRELIEPLRCGKTLVELDSSMRQEKYRDAGWICLRGDGPIDLLLKSASDLSLVEALLTFRMQEAYCELSYKNGKLKTGRMLDRPGDSGSLSMGSRMGSTLDIERSILRHAIYVLMSVPASCRKQVQPLLNEAMAPLAKSRPSGAA